MARKIRWWLDLRFLLTLETKKKKNKYQKTLKKEWPMSKLCHEIQP